MQEKSYDNLPTKKKSKSGNVSDIITSSKVDFLNFMDEDGKADKLCSFVDSIDVDDGKSVTSSQNRWQISKFLSIHRCMISKRKFIS